ncbi:hypothetical protein CC86DRAFT_465586 [Ophiobolus disseminans]|uniref:Zn(2)-C6 fungal-type domain-containing protein n=1 Tax=Ophiobolus disseminans TaxID=1469910 RepID=A0A6A7A6T0_9PLEO|nr:hypothetical protein CC86DRAFT_465586 [Ophiobolus disseminans]
MVNVGGRSKGCSNCRRRRVKCDENRPICMQCERNGLKCDGPRGFAFVEATIVSSRRKVKHDHGTPSAAGPVANMADPSGTSSLTRPCAPLLENHQELYIMFTRKHIAPDGPVDMALQELQTSNTSQLAPTRTVDCRKTHLQAVLSFATIFFGTKNGYSDIMKQGLISHGTTLKQLNQALSNPSCYMYDEVVVSVTTLAMQEMLVPSGPKRYLDHMLGLEKLLTLRDPTSRCSRKTFDLYKCLRHMLLYAALRAGRPSILAKPEWKTLLMQYCGSEEEMREQQLYDALADCSVLAAKLNVLVARLQFYGDGQDNQIDETRLGAQVLLGHLISWRGQVDANPAITYTDAFPCWAAPRSLRTYPDIEPPSVSTDLIFSNIDAALMLMLYNTTLLYVLNVLITLPLEPESMEEYLKRAHFSVLEICKSMPTPSAEELQADMHASPVVYWAIQVADTVLQKDQSPEGRWLLNLLNKKVARLRTKDFKWAT